MSTRGLYGFRKNGIDKTTYNHFDSYPEGLGLDIVLFCLNTSPEYMSYMFDRIEMVRETDTPTAEQVAFCERHDPGNSDQLTSAGWYGLLRYAQGDLEALKNTVLLENKAYMVDNNVFICDSLFCEYAYIINLDTGMLEFWKGFQHEPDETNRYGTSCDGGYYPCRLALELPLGSLGSEEEAVGKMRRAAEAADPKPKAAALPNPPAGNITDILFA